MRHLHNVADQCQHPRQIRRISILGVPVDDVTMQDAVDRVDHWVSDNAKAQAIFAVNPEKIIGAQQNEHLRSALCGAGLLIPDGIGILYAARLLGAAKLPERVPGSELMPAICAIASRKNYSIFLFGGSSITNDLAAQALTKDFPGLKLAGCRNGYGFTSNSDDVIEEINRSGADILFVALGSPKQELWISQNASRLNVKVIQAVGGTFDVIAGTVKRAPSWAIRMNLEWLYRLLSQPSRLRRQTALPKFAWQVYLAVVAGRRRSFL